MSLHATVIGVKAVKAVKASEDVYTLLHFLGSYMLKNYQVMLDFLSLLNPDLLCY